MIKVKYFISNNKLPIIIFFSYGLTALFSPRTALMGIQNSSYYLKEMLTIMPIIFVLTALLDVWIPKETIIKYLGNESQIKGILLSLVLGSISAGPIYAAFPFCVMLKKKGASIRNMTIILSAWAVIKLPMLVNELKFLGITFMCLRWILTIVAILIFSWLTALIVREDEIILPKASISSNISINHKSCIGCGICMHQCPQIFYLKDKKACLKEPIDLANPTIDVAISSCPVNAIRKK